MRREAAPERYVRRRARTLPALEEARRRREESVKTVCGHAQPHQSLCHFLLHSTDHKDLAPNFIRSFRETKSWEKNTDVTAFKKIDLAKLETEWKAWVLAQESKDPAEELLKKWLEERRKGSAPAAPPEPAKRAQE